MSKRWLAALGSVAMLLFMACGEGDRTGFEVEINPDAIASAAASALPEDLVMPCNEGGDVVFSHGVHMISASECAVCHPEPWAMGRANVGSTTMAGMAGGKACGSCHDGEEAFGIDDCGACHDIANAATLPPEMTLPGGGFGQVEFSHKMHLMAGSTCAQCHMEPWALQQSAAGTMEMTPMYGTGSCGKCHDGQAAFDATACARCHDRETADTFPRNENGAMVVGEDELPADIHWDGADVGKVVFSHVNHAVAKMGCATCHPHIYDNAVSASGTLMMKPMYAGNSCGTCHNGKVTFASTDCGGCHEGAEPAVNLDAVEEASAADEAPAADEPAAPVEG